MEGPVRPVSVVFDASALLALLFDEPGGEKLALDAQSARLSTVNLVEVIAKSASRQVSAEDVNRQLARLEIDIVPFSRNMADQAAKLLPMTRAYGLSLADRACLSLGLLTNSAILTADRIWAELDIGVEIRLIR